MSETVSIKKFLYQFDHHIKRRIKNSYAKPSCKKGCWACCTQKILLTRPEAMILANAVNTGQVKIDLDHLRKQSKFDGNSEKWWQAPIEARKCVFLSEEGTCKAYGIRPIACRKHFSVDDPKKCSATSGKESVAFIDFEDEAKSALMNLSNGCEKNVGSMTDFLTEYLESENGTR